MEADWNSHYAIATRTGASSVLGSPARLPRQGRHSPPDHLGDRLVPAGDVQIYTDVQMYSDVQMYIIPMYKCILYSV